MDRAAPGCWSIHLAQFSTHLLTMHSESRLLLLKPPQHDTFTLANNGTLSLRCITCALVTTALTKAASGRWIATKGTNGTLSPCTSIFTVIITPCARQTP